MTILHDLKLDFDTRSEFKNSNSLFFQIPNNCSLAWWDLVRYGTSRSKMALDSAAPTLVSPHHNLTLADLLTTSELRHLKERFSANNQTVLTLNELRDSMEKNRSAADESTLQQLTIAAAVMLSLLSLAVLALAAGANKKRLVAAFAARVENGMPERRSRRGYHSVREGE